jgi:hypothetical protein
MTIYDLTPEAEQKLEIELKSLREKNTKNSLIPTKRK